MEIPQDKDKTLEETLTRSLSKALREFRRNPLNSKYENLQEFEQEIIEDLMERYQFVTLSDTKEILLYENGIYKSGGENKIAIEAEKLYSEISSNRVKEIQNHIKRRTMRNREEFDANPDIINLKNCLFDLKNFKKLPHSCVYLSVVQIPVEYNEDARCPHILNFLKTTLRGSDVKTALALMSCALEGENEFQVAGLHVGSGNNGKGVFQNLNMSFFGKENTANVSLHELETDKYATADLFGKCLNVCGDLPIRPLKDTSIIKKITGRDPLRAQRKNQHAFNFIPRLMNLFSTNKLPETPDKSMGYFRRWVIIPFLKNFEGREDRKILSKLTSKEELSGYLNLLLHSIKWRRKTGQFPGLESIEHRETLYNKMQDSVGYFLKECTEEKNGNYLSKNEFFSRYEQFCQHNNLPSELKESFGKIVKALGHNTTKRTINGKRTYCWKDISLV